MNLIKLFKSLYYRLQSPIVYARKIGVKIGNNCFIDTRKMEFRTIFNINRE